MKLKECFVENFGKLHHYKMEFTDGLNILLEENGFGKTTLAAFIEAVFYGLDSGRGKESNRKKYDPWQGGRFGGSVVFSIGDKNYRLERFFGKKEKEDTFTLYNNDTGLISKDYTENIGTELFGIDKESYEKSAFIPQGKVEADLSKTGDINARLSDLLESENDLASFEDAIKAIIDAKNKFKRTGGIIKTLENSISSLEDEIKKAEELIGIQEDIKNYISEKRKNKKSVQLNIEKAHSDLQKKEKIAFYENLKKDVELSEKRIEALLAEVKKIPEEKELSEIRINTENYKSVLAIYNSKKLTFEEEETLRELKGELGEKILLPDEVGEIKTLFSKYHTLKELVTSADLTDEEDKKLSALISLFERSKPEEELNEILYEAKKCEEGGRNKKFISLITGLLVIFAGIVPSLMNKAIFSVPFFIIGASFLFISVLKNKIATKKNKEFDSKVKAFFKKYDISYTGDIQFSARELKEKTEEYFTLSNKRNQADSYKKNAELLSQEDKIREKAKCFFAGFESVDEAEREFNDLIKKSELLCNLMNKIKELELGKGQIDTALFKLKDLTDEYTDKEPETAYEYLSALKVKKDREEEVLEEKKAKLKEFLKENGVLEIENKEEISKSQLEALNESLELLDEEIISSEKRLMDMATKTDLLPELIEEKDALDDKLNLAKKKLSITEKAEEALSKAKENLAIKYLGPLTENFEKYKRLLLAPGDAKLDTELNVGVVEAGEKHSSASYSAGIRDILALALRFSLIDSLFENEKPLVILDDPFVNLDKERIREAKKALEILSEEYQILYFICHESRK